MSIHDRDWYKEAMRDRDRSRIGRASYSPKQFRRGAQSGPPEGSLRRATWFVFAFLSGAYSMRWLMINGFWHW